MARISGNCIYPVGDPRRRRGGQTRLRTPRSSRYAALVTKKARVYSYAGCGTCRKALKWLAAHGVEVELVAVREQPPTVSELKRAAKQCSSLRALFNTAGVDYRELDLKTRLPEMSEAEAIALLAGNGNLVKRPFVVLPNGSFLVGFAEQAYTDAFE